MYTHIMYLRVYLKLLYKFTKYTNFNVIILSENILRLYGAYEFFLMFNLSVPYKSVRSKYLIQ